MAPTEPADDRQIYDLMVAPLIPQAIQLTLALGVFEALASGSMDIGSLRKELGLGERGAHALLTVLVAMQMLKRDGERYALSDLARRYLLPQSPFCLRSQLGAGASPQAWMLNSLRHDQPRFPERVGAWEQGEALPDAEAATGRMHALSFAPATALAARGAFEGVHRLLDVAGGSGAIAIAAAQHDRALRCTLFELPAVCSVGDAYLAQHGVQDRVALHPGDMFRDPLPLDHDGVAFSNVLHDWDLEQGGALARSAFEALQPGGRIFIHEMLLSDAHDGPLTVALFSLLMLFTTRGRQYTGAELCALLSEAGFVDARVSPGLGYYSLVSARRP